jgi:hypothetical protein
MRFRLLLSLTLASLAAAAAPTDTFAQASVVFTADGSKLSPAAEAWVKNYSAAEDALWRAQGPAGPRDANVFKRGLVDRMFPQGLSFLPWSGAQVNVKEICHSYFPNGCWRFMRNDTDYDGAGVPTWVNDVRNPGTISIGETWLSSGSPDMKFAGLWEYNGTEIFHRDAGHLWAGEDFSPDWHCGTQGPPTWGKTLRSWAPAGAECLHFYPNGWPYWDEHDAFRGITLRHVVSDVSIGADDPNIPNYSVCPTCLPNWGPQWSNMMATYLYELPDPVEQRIVQWIASRIGTSEDPYLAHRFRPVLRFDSDETFRPLNIDALFAEGDGGQPRHSVCIALDSPDAETYAPGHAETEEHPDDLPGAHCERVHSVDDATQWISPDAFIDLDGRDSSTDPDDHVATATCVQPPLRDCDPENSAIYYFITNPTTPNGYRYIDYWFFYRLDSDHEGDWEGVEIVPTLAGDTFDFASFSAHGDWWSYTRDNLICEDGVVGAEPDHPECSDELGNPIGKHVRVHPSAGKHANYPEPCSGGACPRPGGGILGEPDYDGQKPWAGNNDLTGTTLLPVAGTSWFDWDGSWGATNGADGPANSPGQQPPDADHCADNVCPPRPSARRARAAARNRHNARCRTWFGPQVVAALCTPRLGGAVRAARLGRRGNIRLQVVRGARSAAARKRRTSADSVVALAQAVGPALARRDRLRVRGRVPRGTVLFVRGVSGRRVVERRFKFRSARRGLTVRLRGKRLVIRRRAR